MLPTSLRVLPWLTNLLVANLVHYSALLQARHHDRRSPDLRTQPHPLHLSFDLINSPTMRLARYRIKLFRYFACLLHLCLFLRLLPEIHSRFVPGWGTIEAVVVGCLSGFVTVYLNENRTENMRTLWRPKVDFNSTRYGYLWDTFRFVGGSLFVPIEEELFYHSWLYRYLCQRLSKGTYRSFTEVPFWEWNCLAWLVSNAFLALYNGQEWRSYGICGLLSNWVIVRRGQFLDGIIAHSIHSITISCWVLTTGQRQFW